MRLYGNVLLMGAICEAPHKKRLYLHSFLSNLYLCQLLCVDYSVFCAHRCPIIGSKVYLTSSVVARHCIVSQLNRTFVKECYSRERKIGLFIFANNKRKRYFYMYLF